MIADLANHRIKDAPSSAQLLPIFRDEGTNPRMLPFRHVTGDEDIRPLGPS